MKLSCELEISYRLVQGSGKAGCSKRSRCLLSIGRKGEGPREGLQLIVSTVKNVNGSAYKCNSSLCIMDTIGTSESVLYTELGANVIQIFGKFVKEGKATIRINEPAHDLCISKADPNKLKEFLLLIKLPSKDQKEVEALCPLKSKDLDKPPTKLTIKSRSEYPSKGWPLSLETVIAPNIGLHRIDRRLFTLEHLRYLDLNSNAIQCIPEEINKVPLNELYLSGNNITELPVGLCYGPITVSLKVLDISRNSLTSLPHTFTQFKSLVQLKLDCNKLRLFPRAFGGKNQTTLRYLSASCNELVVLPFSFSTLRLESLDLYGNPFQATGLVRRYERLNCPPLTELSARAVKKYKVLYSTVDTPVTLCHYLDSHKRCLCGTYCFTAYLHYIAKLDLHTISNTVTAVDQHGLTSLPIELYLCSAKCLKLWR